jgi:hypothetical protein
MKNSLKTLSEDWIKEREIGQFSFFMKRTVVFSLFLIPLNLFINYLLSFINDDLKITAPIRMAIGGAVGIAASEWWGLESEYRKSIKKEKSGENQ